MLIVLTECLLMVVLIISLITLGYCLQEIIKILIRRRKHGKHKRTHTGTN